jgi:hypothetical protein
LHQTIAGCRECCPCWIDGEHRMEVVYCRHPVPAATMHNRRDSSNPTTTTQLPMPMGSTSWGCTYRLAGCRKQPKCYIKKLFAPFIGSPHH